MFLKKIYGLLQDIKSQLKIVFDSINKKVHHIDNSITSMEHTVGEINDKLNNLDKLIRNVACINQLNIINFYFDVYEKNISTIKDDKELINNVTYAISHYVDQLSNSDYLEDENIVKEYQDRINDIINMINNDPSIEENHDKSKSGRKKITQEKIDQIINLYETSVNSHTEIARIVGVSRSTVDKYIKKYEHRN